MQCLADMRHIWGARERQACAQIDFLDNTGLFRTSVAARTHDERQEGAAFYFWTSVRCLESRKRLLVGWRYGNDPHIMGCAYSHGFQ